MAAAFLVVYLSEGFAGAVKKRISEVGVESSEYLTLGLLVHVVVTLLTLAVLLLGRPLFVPYFGSAELTVGVGVVTGTLGFFTLLNACQAGVGYPGRSTWFDTIRSVLTLTGQVALLVIGFQAFGLVVGLSIATFLSGVLAWLSIRVPLAVPTARTARRVFKFARHSIPSGFVGKLYQSADPLLIRAFAGAGGVGFYTVASQLVMPGALFGSSIAGALGVKASGVDSVGGEVRRDLVNAVSYAGLLSIPILFGSLALPSALMQADIFGSTYENAPGAVLVGLALFQISNSYRSSFGAAISGVDRPDINFRLNLIVTAIYAPVAVVLGSIYGLLGVVAGTVVAEGVRLVAYQLVSVRLFDGTVLPRPVGEQFFAGVVMFLAVEGVSRVTNPSRLSVLVSLVGFGAVVYFTTLVVVSRHFRETVARTLGEFR
jgi:O-antigen/teichoic acid export membrane protein